MSTTKIQSRVDHYYSLESGVGGLQEGHILCTPDEGVEIEKTLRDLLPEWVMVKVVRVDYELYDFTTEGSATVALDILNKTGFGPHGR